MMFLPWVISESICGGEYDLLKVLIHHAGNVRTHRELIPELWGTAQYQDPVHLLRVTMSHLRPKLQPDPMKPRYICD
jgi:two-component system, OmpR family, KDP operon response regulator KdpE